MIVYNIIIKKNYMHNNSYA